MSKSRGLSIYINQFNLQKFVNLVESFSIENITYILDFRIILNYSNKPRIPKFLPPNYDKDSWIKKPYSK